MTRTICPTCNGKGEIKNPKSSMNRLYPLEMITCPNCQGEGFVGSPDVLPIKKSFYRSRFIDFQRRKENRDEYKV